MRNLDVLIKMRSPEEKNVNIDLEIHKKLKIRAIKEDITLKKLINKILKEALEN